MEQGPRHLTLCVSHLSDMYYKDGSSPEPAINDLFVSGYFTVQCANSHENDVRAPMDATIMGAIRNLGCVIVPTSSFVLCWGYEPAGF